jgi:hypothetical protein
MSKALTLKVRQADGLGGFGWHDYNLLVNAIGAIVKGKDVLKGAMWIILARKIQMAAEAANLFKSEVLTDEAGELVLDKGQKLYRPKMVSISVTIKNQEASLLWRELSKMKLEQFSAGGQAVPHIGLLSEMLFDLAEQLGEKMPEEDEDENVQEES